VLNVFSLPEMQFCDMDWMTVFSLNYPSTSCKVCVDMLSCMIACVNANTSAQMLVRARWHRHTTALDFIVHAAVCNVPVVFFLQGILQPGWDCQGKELLEER
jgi:hypothetical protein